MREARAVVVGGGLLGLQVARALSIRGLHTEIVEGAEHLLASQLGEPGGRVLARDLRRLGTDVYTGARAIRMTEEGVRLDNGYELSTDLIVLTAGGRPSTALARRAELMVRRGVVVDSTLRSVTDDRIHAIGDCAEHRRRVTGFVPPAWEQAGVLADVLTGGFTRYDGSRSVARLRATDLEVAVLGDPERASGEIVEMTNPIAGSHRRLVIEGGVIVAAALVGDLSRVGLITQLYDRGTVLGPDEPGQLLLGEAAAEPVTLPDETEVCACAGVSAGAIRACSSFDACRESTRATTGCGGCEPVVRRLLAEERRPRRRLGARRRTRRSDCTRVRGVQVAQRNSSGRQRCVSHILWLEAWLMHLVSGELHETRRAEGRSAAHISARRNVAHARSAGAAVQRSGSG